MNHSDTKKLDHFTHVTLYLLLSQLTIFQRKAEREMIVLLKLFKDVTLSPLFLFMKTICLGNKQQLKIPILSIKFFKSQVNP